MPTDEAGGDDEEMFGYEVLPDSEKKISNYFTMENRNADYVYDFGDDWRHTIELESITPRDRDVAYPRCIEGENACPPEDCGGGGGFHRFKKSMSYLNAADHDEMVEWSGVFDPKWFDLDLVRFGSPSLRWRIAFEDAPAPKSLRQVQYHSMKDGNVSGS